MTSAPHRRRRSRCGRALTSIAASVLVLAACTGGGAQDDTGATTSTTAAPAATDTFAQIPDIVEEVEPSVVSLNAGEGIGSGVIVDADGLIVTNAHVVRDLETVEVVFADGVRTTGEVLATAPVVDIAVVQTERSGLPAATFASELPRVGDLAIAIGSPLGLEQTITVGVVSGLNRSIPGSAQVTPALVDLIQTDAPISPGSSGGALVDADGQVIGMSVAFLPPAVGAVSLGFAIPGAEVSDAVDDLVTTGRVTLAFIGVVPGRLTPEIAERFSLERDRGVIVADVLPDGPAATAGIEPGDLVASIDGEEVETVEEFLGELRRREPGDQVEVEVVRGGEPMTFTVELTERPAG